ncbi:phage tail sheath C-terminal domain-containing protein [Terasakiella sp. A23]|uniref:phage tail sheath subtilisin-like domain-containing protein n=1 Tax=Terasakiella sp. FCG-A23 TaxID=3080561 RepID=UPI0029536361|nr:phage tail sheath subtilisin-like domain-containing protein [Terasakiella sp. A23]MDV7340972.1 phage tail sheath C-terminal domain-containing protein [Terasakiella sp. A23]
MSEAISFTEMPIDIWTPGIYMEIDPSLALNGLPVFKQRTVMWGQLGTGAEASVNQIYHVIGNEAKTLFGADAMLTDMVKAFRKKNKHQELLIIPLAENVAGNQASATVTLAGAASRGNTFLLYIGEKRYQLGVTAAETASSIAGRLATIINNDPSSQVTASVVGEVLTLTCKWKGETGNDLNVFTRYHSDDQDVPGITTTIVGFNGGTGNPDLTDAIDTLDDLTQYQGFVNPYTDEANMTVLRAELDERWGVLSANDGRAFCALKSGVAALNTWALTRNSQNIVPINAGLHSRSPTWAIAASFAADIMYSGATDPAVPFDDMELIGIYGAPLGLRTSGDENESLLGNGVSTLKVGGDKKVRIQRAVTSYGMTASGAEDEAYKSLNTVMQMSYYRRSVINYFQTKFPGHKLQKEGGKRRSRAARIMSPEAAIRHFLIHYDLMYDDAGIMDDFEGYKADILSNKNTQKRGRLDVFDQPRPMDQLHQLAVRSAFRLI